jgi:hypothetical protein
MVFGREFAGFLPVNKKDRLNKFPIFSFFCTLKPRYANDFPRSFSPFIGLSPERSCRSAAAGRTGRAGSSSRVLYH